MLTWLQSFHQLLGHLGRAALTPVSVLVCVPCAGVPLRRPLELHHTVLAGSRTFKCSLMYNPGPQQLVTVTVQEVGRR